MATAGDRNNFNGEEIEVGRDTGLQLKRALDWSDTEFISTNFTASHNTTDKVTGSFVDYVLTAPGKDYARLFLGIDPYKLSKEDLKNPRLIYYSPEAESGYGTVYRNDGVAPKRLPLNTYVHAKLTVAKRGEETLTVIGTSTLNNQSANRAMDYYISTTDKDVYKEAKQITQWFTGEGQTPTNLKHFLISGRDSEGNPLPDASEKFIQQIKDSTGAIWIASANLSHEAILKELIAQAKTGREVHVALSERDFTRGEVNLSNLNSDQKALMRENAGVATFSGLASAAATFAGIKKLTKLSGRKAGLIAGIAGLAIGAAIELVTPFLYGKRQEYQIKLAEQVASSGKNSFIHLIKNSGFSGKDVHHANFMVIEDPKDLIINFGAMRFNKSIMDGADSRGATDILFIGKGEQYRKAANFLIQGIKDKANPNQIVQYGSHYSRPVDYFMPKRGSQVTRYVLTADMLKETRDWALSQGLPLEPFMKGEGLGVGLYRGLKLYNTGEWEDKTPEDIRNYEIALNFDQAMQAPTIGQSDWWSRTNFSIGTGIAAGASIYAVNNLLGFADNKKYALAAALIGGVAAGSVMSWMGSKFENAYGPDVFKQHGMRGPIDSFLLKISKRIDEDMSKLAAVGGQQDYGHSSTMQTIVGTSFDVIDTLVWNIATYEYLTLPALRLGSSGYKRLVHGLEKRAYAPSSDKTGKFVGKSLSKGLLNAINFIDMAAMYAMGTLLEGAVLPYAGLFGKEVEKGVQQMTDVFKGKENYRAYRQADRNIPGSLYRSFQIADEVLSRLPFFKMGSTKGRTIGAVFAAYDWGFAKSVSQNTIDLVSSKITDVRNRNYFSNKMTTVEGQSVRTLDELKRLGTEIENATDRETKKLNIQKLKEFAKQESLDRLLSAQAQRTLRSLQANIAEIDFNIKRLEETEINKLVKNARASASTSYSGREIPLMQPGQSWPHKEVFIGRSDALEELDDLLKQRASVVNTMETLKDSYYTDLSKLESPFTRFSAAIKNWKNPFILAYGQATGISGAQGGRMIYSLAGAATGPLVVFATATYALNGLVGSLSSAARVTLAEQEEYETMMNSIKGKDRVSMQIYRTAGFPRYDINWGEKYGFVGKLAGGIVGLAQFYTERVRASLINMFGGPAKTEIDGRSQITNEIAGAGTFAMATLALKAGNLSSVLSGGAVNVKDALNEINKDGYKKKLSEEALLASLFMQPNSNTDTSNISSSFALRFSPSRHILTITPFQQSSVRGITTFSSSIMGPASLPIGVSISYPIGIKSYTILNKDGKMEKTYGGLFGLFDTRNYAKGRDPGTGIVWVPGTTFENMTYMAIYYHGVKFLTEKLTPKKFHDSTLLKTSLKGFDFFYKLNTLPFHVTKAVAGEFLSLGGSFDFKKIGRAFTENKGLGRARVLLALGSEMLNINQDIKAYRTMRNAQGLNFSFTEAFRVLVRSPLGKERLDSVISIVNERLNSLPEAQRKAYEKAIGYEVANETPRLGADVEKGVSGQRITQSAYHRINKIKERILGGSVSAQERTALEVFENSKTIKAIKSAGKAGAIFAATMVAADILMGAIGSAYSEEFATSIYHNLASFAINNLGPFGLWFANFYKVRPKDHPIATTYVPKYLPELGEDIGDKYEHREGNLTGVIFRFADHVKRSGQLFLKGLTEGVYSGLGYFGIVQDRIEEDKYATLKTYTNIPFLGAIISYSEGITTPKENLDLKNYISAQNYSAGTREADAYLRSMHRKNKKPAALGKMFHQQAGLGGLGISAVMEQSRRTSLTHWVLANNSGFDTARYFFLRNTGPADKSLFRVEDQPGAVEIAGFVGKVTYNKMMKMTKTAYSLFQSAQRSSQEAGELGQIDFSSEESYNPTDQLFDSPSGINALYEHDLRAKNSLFSQVFTAGAVGILGLAAGAYIYKNRYPRKVSKNRVVSELDKKLNPSKGMQKVIDEYGPRAYGAASDFLNTVTGQERKNFYMSTHGVNAARSGFMVINDGEFEGSRVKYPGHRYWLVKIGTEGNYYTFGDLPAHGTDPLHNVSPANYKRVVAQVNLGKSFGQMNFAPVSEFFLQLTRMTHIGGEEKGIVLNRENSLSARAALARFTNLVKVHEDFYYSTQRMAANAEMVYKQLDAKETVLTKELERARGSNEVARIKILESMLAKVKFDKATVGTHMNKASGIAAEAKTALHGNTENLNFKEAKAAAEEIKKIQAELDTDKVLKNDVEAYNRALLEKLDETKIGERTLTEIIEKSNQSDLRNLAKQLGNNIDETVSHLGFKSVTETTLYKIQGFFGKGGFLALGSASLKEKALSMRAFFPMVSSTEIFTSYSRFWENTGNLNKWITDWYNNSFDEFYRENVVKDVRSMTAEAFNRGGVGVTLSEETSQHAAKQWELFVRSYIENGEVLGSGAGNEGATALEEWRFVMQEFVQGDDFRKLNELAGAARIDEVKGSYRANIWNHSKFVTFKTGAAIVKGLFVGLSPVMYAAGITDPFKRVGTPFVAFGIAGDRSYGIQDRELATKAGLRDMGSGAATLGVFGLGMGAAYGIRELHSAYGKNLLEAGVTRRGIFGFAKDTAQRKALTTAAKQVGKQALGYIGKRALIGAGVGLLEGLTFGSAISGLVIGAGVALGLTAGAAAFTAGLLAVGVGIATEIAYEHYLKEKVDKWWYSMVDGQETKIVNHMEEHSILSAPGRMFNYASEKLLALFNAPSTWLDSWIQKGQRPDATAGDRALATTGSVLQFVTSFIKSDSATNYFYQPQGITGTDISSSEHLWRLPENAGPAGSLASLTPIHYGTERNAINKLISQQERLREADQRSLLNFWFHQSNFGVETDMNNTTITGITPLSQARQNIFRSFSNLSVFGEASATIMAGRSMETGHQLAQLLNRKFDFYNDKKNPEITKGQESKKGWTRIGGKKYAHGPAYNVGLRGHVKLLPVFRNMSPFTTVVDSPFINSKTPDSTPTGIVLPTETNKYTSAYGEKRIFRQLGDKEVKEHKGMDFAGNVGDPIYAAAAGTVVFSGSVEGYGNHYIVIKHSINGVVKYTGYGHNSASMVKTGDKVSAKQLIGSIGQEGHATGPHLHFSVSRNDPRFPFSADFIDPARFLRGLSGKVGGGKGGVDLPVSGLSISDIKNATSRAMIEKNVKTFASMNRYKIAKDRLRDYEEIVQAAHRKYPTVAENLIRAVITQESTGHNTSRSQVGAGGLMQLMPATAKDLGVKDRFNPRDNIFGGTRYLSHQLIRYKGDVTKALMAYNAGPGNVDSGRAYSFSESVKYAPAVIAYLAMYNLEQPAGKTGKETTASTVPSEKLTKHIDVTVAASTDVPGTIDNNPAKNMIRKAVTLFELVTASVEKIFNLSAKQARKLLASATYPSGENWQSLYDNHYTPGIEFTGLDNHHGSVKF